MELLTFFPVIHLTLLGKEMDYLNGASLEPEPHWSTLSVVPKSKTGYTLFCLLKHRDLAFGSPTPSV